MTDFREFDDLVLRDSKHTELRPMISSEDAAWLRETPQLHNWMESLTRRIEEGKAHIQSRSRKIERLEGLAKLAPEDTDAIYDWIDAVLRLQREDRDRVEDRNYDNLRRVAKTHYEAFVAGSEDARDVVKELELEIESLVRADRSTERFISGLNDRLVEASLLVRQRAAPLDPGTVMAALVKIRGTIDPLNSDSSGVDDILDSVAEIIDDLIEKMGGPSVIDTP